MEKLFIDCEFNGFGGELISMGIVDCHGNEFYEVLHVILPREWVKTNIIPVLKKEPIFFTKFQEKLQEFLCIYPKGFCLIAAWPEDIKHFNACLTYGDGRRMIFPNFEMRIDFSLNSINSKLIHNALDDAHAIKIMYFEKESL